MPCNDWYLERQDIGKAKAIGSNPLAGLQPTTCTKKGRPVGTLWMDRWDRRA